MSARVHKNKNVLSISVSMSPNETMSKCVTLWASVNMSTITNMILIVGLNQAACTRLDYCAIWIEYDFCSLYGLCDTHEISSAHGGHSDLIRYPLPQVSFVFSSFQ